MTKEEPDQLINTLARTSYPLASSGAVRRPRPGGSGAHSCSLRLFGSPVIAPLPPPDAAVQERVSLRATFTEHSSNERAMISSSVCSISGRSSGRSRSSCRTFPRMFAMKAWRAVKRAFVTLIRELKLSLSCFSAHAILR